MKIPSWMNIVEVDNWIKQNTSFVPFGLYEIDKNIHNSILTYFSAWKSLSFEYNQNITIHIIRSTLTKKNFDQYQIFLENINLYLSNDNPNIPWIKSIVEKINPSSYPPSTKAWRILRYLQQEVYKTHKKDVSGIRNTKKKIILGEDTWIGKINISFWIIDNFFSEETTYSWFPNYNKELIDNKLKELATFKKINTIFFQTEKDSWIDPNDNNSLFQQYISFLNSKASAKIEGYDISEIDSLKKLRANKETKKHWGKSLHAVMNLMNCSKKIANDFNKHKKLNLNFLHGLQKIVVDKTWDNNESEEDKTPWFFRNFEICVLDRKEKRIYPSKSWEKTNKAFIAPNYSALNSLIQALINFYNQSLGKIDDYILAVLLKLLFVIIHPYGDWNGRTSRLLFEWSLLNTGWIENWGSFPISFTINNHKKAYYQALQDTTEPSLYHIDCLDDHINKRFIVSYENDNIFLNLDMTPFLLYSIELWKKCFIDAMFEYQYFKTRDRIRQEINQNIPNLNKDQLFVIENLIKNKLIEYNWGKKTNKKLAFLNEEKQAIIQSIILKHKENLKKIEIDGLNEEESNILMEALKNHTSLL